MKKTVILFISIFIFSSCSKDNDDTTEDYHGKWILVKMSGSIQNSETTGSAMEWQEFYLFNNDATFTKSRTRNTVTTTASGTYITQNGSDGLYLELTYSKDSEIIGSCYRNQKEALYFRSNTILSNTWNACDGPGLDYQKVD